VCGPLCARVLVPGPGGATFEIQDRMKYAATVILLAWCVDLLVFVSLMSDRVPVFVYESSFPLC